MATSDRDPTRVRRGSYLNVRHVARPAPAGSSRGLAPPARLGYTPRLTEPEADAMQGSANLNVMIKAARKAGRGL
ncbi:MAG: hypothetical protein AAF390_06210, partial [Pseudomonadota bacterium]